MTMTSRAALALCAALALPLAACAKDPDAAFGQKVRAYLLAHPEVIEEAVQKLQENKQVAAAEAARASLGKFRAQLERDPRDFVANPDGKITVVEFFDYRCGYCKVSAPEVVKLINENPDVRFVFKEFPIFGGESNLAAQVALSPVAKPKTKALFTAFMAEKALDEAAIDRHLRAAGIDPAIAKKEGASEAVQKHIADTRALAQALAIEGTPAFIIGDRLIPGADMAAVRAAIAEAKTGTLKTVPNVKPS
ncbi:MULTISPECIES: DsbA family protein [unclassified Phenylobacterium]|uniref:DsbA family protein n=1 Tax=unclassified Phenylobacterium TaxID=2640670 RepID=UPI0006FFDBCC|nr:MULTISPECIES: DsbA family protein [unclassified Phenylobacterium]KRB44785.1 disulfide bond formation protein DsbA [Phenylobacterium sp. Root700]MBT9473007.1 DsbA family protein [Phenylobacterium sp.]